MVLLYASIVAAISQTRLWEGSQERQRLACHLLLQMGSCGPLQGPMGMLCVLEPFLSARDPAGPAHWSIAAFQAGKGQEAGARSNFSGGSVATWRADPWGFCGGGNPPVRPRPPSAQWCGWSACCMDGRLPLESDVDQGCCLQGQPLEEFPCLALQEAGPACSCLALDTDSEVAIGSKLPSSLNSWV